jgi:hypothetical protein
MNTATGKKPVTPRVNRRGKWTVKFHVLNGGVIAISEIQSQSKSLHQKLKKVVYLPDQRRARALDEEIDSLCSQTVEMISNAPLYKKALEDIVRRGGISAESAIASRALSGNQ